MSDKATIQAELTGAGQVASEAKKIGGALEGAKKQGEGAAQGLGGVVKSIKGVGDAAEGIGQVLSPKNLFGGLIGGGIAAALGAGVSYLKEGRTQAIEFNKATAELARRGGTGYAELRAQIEGVEVATLRGKDEQIAYIDALDHMNYSGEGARASLQGIAAAATAAGRSMADFAGTAASLHEIYGAAKDITPELDRLTATAERFGTKGGAKAYADSLAALRPILATLGPMSEEAAHRFDQLRGQVGARFKPEQQVKVMSQLVGSLQANAPAIERSLGIKIRDENGQIADPEAALRRATEYVRKRSSSQTEMLRRLEGAGFGSEGAAFLASNNFVAGEQGGPSQEEIEYVKARRELKLDEIKGSAEGARDLRDIKSEQRQRHAGQGALAVTDAAGAAWEEGMWGRGGAGKAAENVLSAGAKELGEQAIRAGGFNSEIVNRAGGAESPMFRGTVSYLAGRGELPQELAEQVRSAQEHFGIDERKLGQAVGREVADALQRAPLRVNMPTDPNRSRGQ